jgi:hypothetical protein
MLIGQKLPFTARSLVHDNLFWLEKPLKKKGATRSNKLTLVNSAFRTNSDPVSPLKGYVQGIWQGNHDRQIMHKFLKL